MKTTDIDDCATNPCKHGGFCIDLVNNYTCNCSTNRYSGENCEICKYFSMWLSFDLKYVAK